jgi:hypothetical protein
MTLLSIKKSSFMLCEWLVMSVYHSFSGKSIHYPEKVPQSEDWGTSLRACLTSLNTPAGGFFAAMLR